MVLVDNVEFVARLLFIVEGGVLSFSVSTCCCSSLGILLWWLGPVGVDGT